MADDLVRLLREYGGTRDPYDNRDSIEHEAADRIEALEECLRLIIEHPADQSEQYEIGCKEMKKVAANYLGGKYGR